MESVRELPSCLHLARGCILSDNVHACLPPFPFPLPLFPLRRSPENTAVSHKLQWIYGTSIRVYLGTTDRRLDVTFRDLWNRRFRKNDFDQSSFYISFAFLDPSKGRTNFYARTKDVWIIYILRYRSNRTRYFIKNWRYYRRVLNVNDMDTEWEWFVIRETTDCSRLWNEKFLSS